MNNKKSFKAERINGVIKNASVRFKAFMTVHADEVNPDTSTSTPSPSQTINYEQLIAQARKEEKDKLYPRITKLEEEKTAMTNSINGYLIKIGDLSKTVETLKAENELLKKGDAESQLVKDLKKQISDLEADNKKLKDSAVDKDEIEKKIREEYEIKSYIAEKKRENKDKIFTPFMDAVTGKTQEEVDKALQDAIDKSETIKKELNLTNDTKDKSGASVKTTKSNPIPKVNPSASTGEVTPKYTAEYLRNLDPSSEEYKEFRKSMGLR